MYKWNGRVRFSEVGEDKRLTLDRIVDYFQDCSTFHRKILEMAWKPWKPCIVRGCFRPGRL